MAPTTPLKPTTTTVPVVEPYNPLLKGLKELLASGNFSDLMIVCGDRSWNVHKNVVSLQSSFFLKACNGKLKEAKENKITLLDDDADTVNTMFLYNFEYVKAPLNLDLPKQMIRHVKIYNLADKYDIGALQNYAAEAFDKLVVVAWDIDGFAQAIDSIYEDGPSTSIIRESVVKVVCKNAKALLNGTDQTHKAFQTVFAKRGELAAAVARHFVFEAPAILDEVRERFKCPSCKNTFAAKMKPGTGLYHCHFCISPQYAEVWQRHRV